jgi:uncharacterized protein YyaL (SSP411 family)
LEDSPIPSGNSAAALALLRLALLSGEGRYERHALGVLRLLFSLASRHPLAFGHLLRAADFYVSPVREVAIVGPESEAEALIGVVRERFRPHVVLAGLPAGSAPIAGGESDGVPLLKGREPVDGGAAAYVCEHFACQAPVTTPAELQAALTPAAA